MNAALEALNRLVADGVIENYALGGAMGASFFLPAMVDLESLRVLAAHYDLSIQLKRATDSVKRDQDATGAL